MISFYQGPERSSKCEKFTHRTKALQKDHKLISTLLLDVIHHHNKFSIITLEILVKIVCDLVIYQNQLHSYILVI